MPATRRFPRKISPGRRSAPVECGSNEGIVVAKGGGVVGIVVVGKAVGGVVAAPAVIAGEFLVVVAPVAVVAGRGRLFADDFFNHLWLLRVVAEQAADAFCQHHTTGHAGCGFQCATEEATTDRCCGRLLWLLVILLWGAVVLLRCRLPTKRRTRRFTPATARRRRRALG